MKRVLSLLVLMALLCTALIGCKDPEPVNTEKTYSLVVVTDSSVKNNKVSNVGLALVIDADNKIVAARFDNSEVTPTVEEGALVNVPSITSKVEQGDSYGGGTAEKPAMKAGSFAKQTKAFEDAIVGKTADEVANLDMALVAGCTMASTTPIFKSLVAKAFAYERKVTFKTSETVTVGFAIDMAVKGSKVSADLAGVAMAGGKVVACAIDSVEQAFTVEADAPVGPTTAAVSKNEQGDDYKMPAGPWYKQAQAFANSAVGKTAAELANLETVSDALAAAGCTMKNTTAGYKATIISAASYAR